MTNPMDTLGPAAGTWAWSLQREMDNLHRLIETRYSELSTRIDKVVSSTEYSADKRTSEQQYMSVVERLSDVDKEVELFKRDTADRLEAIRKEHDADIDKVGLLLNTEKSTRESERLEDLKQVAVAHEMADAARVDKKRWLMASVVIPVLIMAIPLLWALKS